MEQRASEGLTFLDADRAFHTMLLERIDNSLAGQLVAAFWDVHSAVIPQLELAMPADIEQTARAHGNMLTAARRGDVAAYREAVIQHYEPLRRTLNSRA